MRKLHRSLSLWQRAPKTVYLWDRVAGQIFFVNHCRPSVALSCFAIVSSRSIATEGLLLGGATENHLSEQLICPGCGAPGQTRVPDTPGFYSNTRWNKNQKSVSASRNLDSLRGNDTAKYEEVAAAFRGSKTGQFSSLPCDRCHGLVHHSRGQSVPNVVLSSLKAQLAQSSSAHNHLYVVIDAADFPLSLIRLDPSVWMISRFRSRNRRARVAHPSRRMNAISFIISRSDLLAPSKELVDQLMPQLRMILRRALGIADANVRMGEIYCISAKRHWWTQQLRQDIFNRQEAAWLLGRVNVGKSQLCQSIFPNARMIATGKASPGSETGEYSQRSLAKPTVADNSIFPMFPTISALPGTTAEPIRLEIPGRRGGEIIDLPGLPRRSLASYVQPQHQASFFMQERATAQEKILLPGQSMLIGDLISITPQNLDTSLSALVFLPVKVRVDSTSTIHSIQNQQDIWASSSIANPHINQRLASAGSFLLRHDVTRHHVGHLMKRPHFKGSARALPFSIFGIDVLIEGSGWVEFTVQLRNRRLEEASKTTGSSFEDVLPSLQITSPEGRLIGVREPLNIGNILKRSNKRRLMAK